MTTDQSPRLSIPDALFDFQACLLCGTCSVVRCGVRSHFPTLRTTAYFPPLPGGWFAVERSFNGQQVHARQRVLPYSAPCNGFAEVSGKVMFLSHSYVFRAARVPSYMSALRIGMLSSRPALVFNPLVTIFPSRDEVRDTLACG